MPKEQAALPLTPAVVPPATGTALAVPPENAGDMIGLLELAVEKGVTVEMMERLMAMKERSDDRASQKALVAALAAFQIACPEIPKTRKAVDTRGDGNKVLYRYAGLEEIDDAIRDALSAHGLAVTYDMGEEQGRMTVTCIVSHVEGGEKRTTFTSPVGDGTSIMSKPQKQAATFTYGKRQALVAALGLTCCDEDNDGAGAPAACITEKQVADLRALLDEAKVPEDKFCQRAGIGALGDMEAKKYDNAVRALRNRAGAGK